MANDKNLPNFFNPVLSNLWEDISQVTVDVAGAPVYYLPASELEDGSVNSILGEVKQKVFEEWYSMRLSMEDPTMIQTNSNLMNKFDLEIMDEGTYWLSRREFRERITGVSKKTFTVDEARQNDVRPKVNDLLYIPMVDSMFQVTTVEDHENMHLGNKSYWRIDCRKYDYRNDSFIRVSTDTGDAEEHQEAISILQGEVDRRDEELDNINDDPTQTGYDVTSTRPINDDIAVDTDYYVDTDNTQDIDSLFDGF